MVGRVVNFFTPVTLAYVVAIFEEGNNRSPWPYLLAYIGLRFLQGNGGLAALRDVGYTQLFHLQSDTQRVVFSFFGSLFYNIPIEV